eukprot:Pgem_evm2s4154
MGMMVLVSNDLCINTDCQGHGKQVLKYYPECKGQGLQHSVTNIVLKIPPQFYKMNDQVSIHQKYTGVITIKNLSDGNFFYKPEDKNNLWYNLVIPYISSITGFKKQVKLLNNQIFNLKYNNTILTANTILRYKGY